MRGSISFLAVALLFATAAHAVVVDLPPVELAPHSERQVCRWFQLRLGRPGWTLAGFRVRIRGASHHFFLFDATDMRPRSGALVDGLPAACADGPTGVPLVAAGAPRAALVLPEGVRLPWQSPQALVMDLHAVNDRPRPVRVRIRVSLRLRPTPPGTRIASRYGFSVDDAHVPPFSTGRMAARWTLARPLVLLSLAGHMHGRGVELTLTRNGVPWYVQDDWRHPPDDRYDPPEVLPAGTELALECTYDNGVERPVRRCADGAPCPLVFGQLADDAMCNVQGYALEP
jgi:hypothetical protein